MRFTADTGRGDWIAPRLGPVGTVDGVVPTGFEAYARIFHPAELQTFVRGVTGTCDSTPLSWAASAELLGARMHPLAQWTAMAQWNAMARTVGPVPLDQSDADSTLARGGRLLNPPSVGSLPAELFARIAAVLIAHTADPRDATIGIWHGFGELHGPGTVLSFGNAAGRASAQARLEREWAASVDPRIRDAAENGPTLSLPVREYVLLAGDLRELAGPDWGFAAGIGWRRDLGAGRSPNLVWPADHSWCLGTEIDFDSTLVAGDRALIDALIAEPGIEALEVEPDASLHFDADRINGGRNQRG